MKITLSLIVVVMFFLTGFVVAQEKNDTDDAGKLVTDKVLVPKDKNNEGKADTVNVKQKLAKPINKNYLPSRSVHRARRTNNTIIVDKANRKTQKKRNNPKDPNR